MHVAALQAGATSPLASLTNVFVLASPSPRVVNNRHLLITHADGAAAAAQRDDWRRPLHHSLPSSSRLSPREDGSTKLPL